jgi:hypothetical protein
MYNIKSFSAIEPDYRQIIEFSMFLTFSFWPPNPSSDCKKPTPFAQMSRPFVFSCCLSSHVPALGTFIREESFQVLPS